jgi:hypothetical protein
MKLDRLVREKMAQLHARASNGMILIDVGEISGSMRPDGALQWIDALKTATIEALRQSGKPIPASLAVNAPENETPTTKNDDAHASLVNRARNPPC